MFEVEDKELKKAQLLNLRIISMLVYKIWSTKIK